ncbi:MAG: disulfide oxidoreductase [Candidatus Limnocylindrales bacterium]
MDVTTVISIYGLLALVGIVVLAWFALMALASFFADSVAVGWAGIRERLTPFALTAAWGVALLAAAGSLYFSESANYIPCTLCWYQRIAMYPLVLILGIAIFRRDIGVRVYAIPLAAVGAAIATYHWFLERFPELDYGACSSGIPCTQKWFEEFGFITLPFLALVAFGLVITFLLIPPLRRSSREDEDEDEGDVDDEGEGEEASAPGPDEA